MSGMIDVSELRKDMADMAMLLSAFTHLSDESLREIYERAMKKDAASAREMRVRIWHHEDDFYIWSCSSLGIRGTHSFVSNAQAKGDARRVADSLGLTLKVEGENDET